MAFNRSGPKKASIFGQKYHRRGPGSPAISVQRSEVQPETELGPVKQFGSLCEDFAARSHCPGNPWEGQKRRGRLGCLFDCKVKL